MAKLSSINKNERRKKLVKKYAGKYARLKAIADDESLDETERLIARLKMAEIPRSEEHTSELQSLMRISYAVFCLKKKKTPYKYNITNSSNIRQQTTNTVTYSSCARK